MLLLIYTIAHYVQCVKIHYAQCLIYYFVHYAHSGGIMYDKREYDKQFAKENYERLAINLYKGEREMLKKHAKKRGFEKVSDYIRHLISQDMNGSDYSIKINTVNQQGDNTTTININ